MERAFIFAGRVTTTFFLIVDHPVSVHVARGWSTRGTPVRRTGAQADVGEAAGDSDRLRRGRDAPRKAEKNR
jgi:hypothetical protein